MVNERVDSVPLIRQWSSDWLLVGLRLVLVALVAKPAVSKFVTYGDSVSFFDAVGMPAPAVLVIVAGLIEVAACILLLVGTGERLAALALVPVMIVAILYVGPDWKNLAVLVGSTILSIGGAGPESPWKRVNRLFE